MSQEFAFRAALVVLACILYWNHHIKRRAPKGARKPIPRKGIEVWVFVTPCIWMACLILYVSGVSWFDYTVGLPAWLRVAGVVAMISCWPLSEWVYRELDTQFSKRLELQAQHRLITSGPYRYVRHPMYSILFLCAIATCLISANIFVMLSTLAVAIAMIMRIKQEEHMLVGRFGDAYVEYRQQTGVLLPKLIR